VSGFRVREWRPLDVAQQCVIAETANATIQLLAERDGWLPIETWYAYQHTRMEMEAELILQKIHKLIREEQRLRGIAHTAELKLSVERQRELM